ncbi:TPA: type 1 fimbrial protein [Salmonella enterica subsp. salamae serovar 28:r:e,n,z15]|nr:type 1 fimbrial protein [Salmonella enterica subsp. salamae serovar 28:r:e,n,z15]
MPIYMSNDSAKNQSQPASILGCASISSPTYVQPASITFTLTFYTTSAFDPATAAGKQIFTYRQKVGVVTDKDNKGGQVDVYITGPVTVATAGCAAFNADKKVELGEINASDLRNKPDEQFNKTPFAITLSNCYAKPSLMINLSNNQTKNNLLVNTNGKATGVGVGLGYSTATSSERLDMTKAVTIDATNLNYTGDSGNGVLNMYAFLGVTDKSAISGGTVDTSAVITLSHP